MDWLTTLMMVQQPTAPANEPWYRDSATLTIICIVIGILGLVASYIPLIRPWMKQGRNGQRELRRIYCDAVSSAGVAKTLKAPHRLRSAARSVVDDPQFSEDFMFPNSVSRQTELAEFGRRLRHKLPDVSPTDIQQFLSALFDEVLNGLQHAQHSAWQSKYREWHDELDSNDEVSASISYREQRFLFLSLIHSEQEMRQAERGAVQFFQAQQVPIIRRGGDELIIARPECETSAADWKSLLTRSLAAVRAANAEQKQIHLILHTVTVWNIAFGILLNNRIPLVLYHWQQQYLRLWTIDRSVKDLRSPKMHSGSLPLLNIEYEGLDVGVESEPAEAIVIDLGANHADDDVRRWLMKHQRRMPLRVVKKKEGRLDPSKSNDWIQCAAEIAELIDRIEARNVYFFADMPAVLALMVGDALGPYRTSIHLMQFLNGSPDRDYKEVLVISKELLTEVDCDAC